MAENGREALPRCPGVVEGPYGYPEVVGTLSRMSGNDLEAFPYVRVVRRPSQMSTSGWETLPDVPEWWETLLDVQKLSGVPPDVRKALPVVRQ